MKKIIIFLTFISFLSAKEINVTFISPSLKGNLFWDRVIESMKITAKNLEINLKIIEPTINRQTEVEKLAIENMNSKEKPNYIIFPYFDNSGKKILETAEKNKIYSFIINTDIPDKEKSLVKTPGKIYKYWIGHLFPDDVSAGYTLSSYLLKKAKEVKKGNSINIVALSGAHISNVSLDRNKGLLKSVGENKTNNLLQIFYAMWEYDNAQYTIEKVFNRYNNIDVIWAASDTMALGAIEAIKKKKLIPGKNIIVGGMDWGNEGLMSIKNGELAASMGGHFLEGSSALILIKDHSKGFDIGKFPIKTTLYLINKDNIDKYEKIISLDGFKKIDFKELSKFYNKNRDKYEYDLIKYLLFRVKR